jgi:hypothetical protein
MSWSDPTVCGPAALDLAALYKYLHTLFLSNRLHLLIHHISYGEPTSQVLIEEAYTDRSILVNLL